MKLCDQGIFLKKHQAFNTNITTKLLLYLRIDKIKNLL